MARVKRHYIPGYIWYITHRCPKRVKEILEVGAKGRDVVGGAEQK